MISNYDNWKQATPDKYDYEEENQCGFCGEEIMDGKSYCDSNCRRAANSDRC